MSIGSCPCCGFSAEFRSVPYDRNPNEDKWTYNCFAGKSLAACPSCGSYFTREILSDNELNEFYGNLYQGRSVAALDLTDRYEFTPRFFSQALFLKTQVNLHDGIRILEIGPNQVSALPAMSLFCKPAYYYFEQYEFPIIEHYGGERLGPYFPREYIDGQAKAGKFDLVLMSHSLEHVNPSGLHDTIKSIHAVLEDGGHLFIEVPDQINGAKPPPHTLFFTIEGLKALLESEGFRVTGMQSIDDRPSGQHALAPSGERAVRTGEPFLAMIIRKSFGLCSRITRKGIGLFSRNPSMMQSLRPILLRQELQERLKKLGVPYSQIPYLRVVAKKISD
jgi:SAM-dependent methyltransferase